MGHSSFVIALACLLLVTALPACTSTQPTPLPPYMLLSGQFGTARTMVRDRQIDNPKNRAYLLDRARVGILTLADGYPESALTVFQDVYDVIRTQGLNQGKEVVAVAINEDLKIWKGEPFEQAITLAYIGMAHASVGSWDNCRAAAENSLFYLRDFGKDKAGQTMSPEELTVAAARHDENPNTGVDIDHGYVVQPSNFTLGYYLHALASQQLGRDDEASDYFRQAVKLQPALADDVALCRAGGFNTVLIVSWGLGPRKVGIGPDNAVASFRPLTVSGNQRLSVRINAGNPTQHAVVTDVNRMARDHMWNNLQDVRIAKSHVGSALVMGGLIATDIALYNDDPTVAAIGAGVALAGAIMKAGAHADTRYNDALPQRYYVVPLELTQPTNTIELSIPGSASARLVLTDVPAPPSGKAMLRYVRLVGGPYATPPLPWATGGQIVYGNPASGPVDAKPYPFVLGGKDARPPSDAVVDDYRATGLMPELTLARLEEVYRQRGVTWTIEDTQGYAGRHVLEGGRSLVSPVPGSVGYMRLFGGWHPPFPNRGGGPYPYLDAKAQPQTTAAAPPKDSP